jgi:hypothetical protein
MKLYEESFDKRLDMMSGFNLTSTNYDLIMCIFMAREEEGKHTTQLEQWAKVHGIEAFRENLKQLIEKRIINSVYKVPNKGEAFIPDDVPFNKNFLKAYLKHSGQLGKELMEIYPSWMPINGKMVGLKSVADRYASLDDFFFAYGKAIGFNPQKHNEILALIEKAKEMNLIRKGILKFVIDQDWNNLQEAMDSGILNYDMKIEFE